MSNVAFDTLKFAQTSRDEAKLSPEQAEGIAEAFAIATSDDLITKPYLDMRLRALRRIVFGMIVGLGIVLVAVKFSGH